MRFIVRSAAEANYNPRFFQLLNSLEDRHFWFTSRRDLVVAFAQQILPPSSAGAPRILEIGCGGGFVSASLQNRLPHARVVGLDVFPEALNLARGRGVLRLVRGDASQPPFGPVFDLVGLFDVLEHIEDDAATLRHVRALVSPGGCLLLTVPSRPSLWSYFDAASGHCRRYTAPLLRRKLEESGFTVDFLTEFMALLLPLAWTRRKLRPFFSPQASGDAISLAMQDFEIGKTLNWLLSKCLALERRFVARRIRLPFGTSLLAVCRRC